MQIKEYTLENGHQNLAPKNKWIETEWQIALRKGVCEVKNRTQVCVM